MKTRHVNELLASLEETICRGFSSIAKDKLKIWYKAERMSASIFADIEDKWANELEQTGSLLVIDNEAELVLINGDGLEPTGTRIVNIKEKIKNRTRKQTVNEALQA